MTQILDERSYPVGRDKPPVETRFKPGQSGNPRGRPKRSKNFTTLLDDELNQTVEITQGGRRRKASKRELVVKQLVNLALKGDLRALSMLAKLSPAAPAAQSASAIETALGGEDDHELMRMFLNSVQDETNEPK